MAEPAEHAADELAALDPEPIRQKLSTGLEVEIVRLKTRQFFRLLKVLTHGAGNAMLKQSMDFGVSGEEFAQRLVGLVLISIPDAEQEAIDFLQSMVKPAHLPDKPAGKLSKAERESSERAWAELYADLYNPELDDLVDLIESIVRTEAPHMQELGKRVASLIQLATRTGQMEEESAEPVPTPEELADSPPPSTNSATSTGGATSTSGTSPSAASSRSSELLPLASAPSLSSASG